MEQSNASLQRGCHLNGLQRGISTVTGSGIQVRDGAGLRDLRFTAGGGGLNTSTLTSSQTIARFASAPENPVISMMASVVEENPAVPLLSATKVRAAPASTNEKVAARLARKVAVVRTALMPA